MPTFQYSNPAVIHWGSGCVREKLGAELDRVGARRALLVTTASATRDTQLAPAVEALLGSRFAGRFSSIGQHAPVGAVAQGVALARCLEPDALVSLGGGSPIDAAKAIAFALATGADFATPEGVARAREAKPGRALPHLAIPTTLSAAELSSSAGFSAEGTREKTGVADPALLAAAVFYDPELAARTPLALWLSTGIRAVDHAAETLLAPGEHPLPDAAAAEALRRLKAALLAAHARPADPGARREGQLGAWLSMLLPGPSSRGLSHTLSKRLGSRHGIPHGVSSCLTLPHVLRALAPRQPEAMARIASALGADDAADAVASLIADLELPRHLAPFGLTEADLAEAVRPVASEEHSAAELLAILRAAL